MEKKKAKLRLGGEEMGLIAAAAALGTGGDPVSNSQDFRALMAAVYGEGAVRNCPVQPRKPSGA